jgi:hypothetical protein
LANSFVKRITVNASTKPIAMLEKIPVRVQFRAGVRELEVKVSSMTVNLVLSQQSEALPSSTLDWREAGWQSLSDARISLRKVEISTENKHATANLIIQPTEAMVWRLDSRVPSLSTADTIASMGSLAQALLYRMDHVERDRVGNFWMRRVTINFDEPRPIRDGKTNISVRIVRTTMLNHQERIWRTARVHASGAYGVDIEADVAYELPAQARR